MACGGHGITQFRDRLQAKLCIKTSKIQKYQYQKKAPHLAARDSVSKYNKPAMRSSPCGHWQTRPISCICTL